MHSLLARSVTERNRSQFNDENDFTFFFQMLLETWRMELGIEPNRHQNTGRFDYQKSSRLLLIGYGV